MRKRGGGGRSLAGESEEDDSSVPYDRHKKSRVDPAKDDGCRAARNNANQALKLPRTPPFATTPQATSTTSPAIPPSPTNTTPRNPTSVPLLLAVCPRYRYSHSFHPTTAMEYTARPRSVKELSDGASSFVYDPYIPLRYWVRTADTLVKEVCSTGFHGIYLQVLIVLC